MTGDVKPRTVINWRKASSDKPDPTDPYLERITNWSSRIVSGEKLQPNALYVPLEEANAFEDACVLTWEQHGNGKLSCGFSFSSHYAVEAHLDDWAFCPYCGRQIVEARP